MILLAIDPGSSCGYALASFIDSRVTIIEYGIITIPEHDVFGHRSIYLMNKVSQMCQAGKVEHIGIEEYFASSKFASGTDVNYYFRGAIQIQAVQCGIPYTMLNISNWKSYVAKRSTPTKEQKRLYGKSDSKKIFIVQALWERFGIRFPNHVLSEKTGKPVLFKYDCVDAVGQVLYLAHLLGDVKEVACSVSPPPDVAFKKSSKKTFAYS